MAKYRKKPIVVEAFKWTGDPDQEGDPVWIEDAIKNGSVYIEYPVLRIGTWEGDMYADAGDYIIQGIKGKIYPCKPDIFEATYEKVE